MCAIIDDEAVEDNNYYYCISASNCYYSGERFYVRLTTNDSCVQVSRFCSRATVGINDDDGEYTLLIRLLLTHYTHTCLHVAHVSNYIFII